MAARCALSGLPVSNPAWRSAGRGSQVRLYSGSHRVKRKPPSGLDLTGFEKNNEGLQFLKQLEQRALRILAVTK